ncbi:MAG: hypothetical protein V4577_23095 [Bacteroidota bacterium]
MVKLSLTISFLLAFIYCNAQTRTGLNKDTSYFKRAPLYILQIPLSSDIEGSGILLNAADIDTVSVLHDSVTIATYGNKAANGIVIFKTRKNIKVLTINELLLKYKVTNTNLPVFIDSVIAYKPNTIYFDPRVIKYVGIEKESVTGLQYISIISNNPAHRLKPGDINIRGNFFDIKVDK